MDEIAKIGGVWMPAREKHMQAFLTDPNGKVDGIGTYQLHKQKRVYAEMEKRGYPFRNAVDVGAHVGTWARFLAARFARVEAFEPHPIHRRCFTANMAELGISNYALHPVALGERATLSYLLSNPESSGDSWLSDGRDHAGYESVATPVETLDSYMLREVDLIKLDCEGGELAALRGGLYTIDRNRPFVVVEQKPGRAEKYNLGRTDACTLLEKLGYERVAEMSGDYLYHGRR